MKFFPGTYLSGFGSLYAVGTAESRILFIFSKLDFNSATGIVFSGPSMTMSYCNIENAFLWNI